MTTTRLMHLLWMGWELVKHLSLLHMMIWHKSICHFTHYWKARMKRWWTAMVIIMISYWGNWCLFVNLFFFFDFLPRGRTFRHFHRWFFHHRHLNHFFHRFYRHFRNFFWF